MRVVIDDRYEGVLTDLNGTGDADDGAFTFTVTTGDALAGGVYSAEIVVERLHPMSLAAD